MINFQQAAITAPKIDIVGKEVPLAALAKTGDTLQDRFERSYENETKTQALMKRALQDVAPEDLPVAQQAFDTYNQRLTERAKSGDYHNMRWQTLQDAQEFGNIYSGLSDRAKKLQQYSDYITTYKGITDPAQKAYELEKWKKAQSSINFNGENRQLTGLGVSAPGLTDEVDMAKFANTYGAGIQENVLGRAGKNQKQFVAGETLPNGQTATVTGIYDIASSKQISQVTRDRVKEVLKSYAQASPEVGAYINSLQDYYTNGQGLSPEQAKQKAEDNVFNKMIEAGQAKFAFTKDIRSSETGLDASATALLNKSNAPDPNIPQFTQLPSAIFNQNKPTDPFKVDINGNISYDKPANKGVNFVRDEFGVRDPNAANLFTTDGKMDLNKFENSISYKRLKTHLTKLGVIGEGSPKKDVNLAIVNFWNQLGNAESSIAVAKPGDEAANKYLDEVNKTYFGDKSPDNPANGTSIKSGQLAQRTFTDENGKTRSSQEVFNDTKNRNVRINGWVDQIESPFEYGSHYMVATDPATGETKNYLVEPDINTKNSGAYFANRIFNSTRDKELKTSWKDGNGTNYEATPIEGGNKFALYVGKDVKTPLILDQKDLQAISQLPAGQANQVIMNYYNSRK